VIKYETGAFVRKSILLLFFFIFCTAFLYAETAEPAILARGPVQHEGIEFLGVNAIPSQYGEYHYNNDEIIVYYTTEEIFFSDKWNSGDCSLLGLRQQDYMDDRRLVSYSDKKGWTVILSFDNDAEYICSFLAAYKSRQNYFLNIARDKTVFSFPALLEVD